MSQNVPTNNLYSPVEGIKANFSLGFRRALPIMLGYTPVAFAFGVLAVKNNIPPALAIAMSIFMFAGSGQFIAISLWASGAGLLSTTMAVLVTNLRYFLMGIALVPYLNKLTGIRRLIFGWQVTDELFAIHVTALQNGWPLNMTALFTATSLAQSAWVAGTCAGTFCGSLLTDVRPLGLDFALSAMFLALLVPQCMNRLHVLTAILAAIFSITMHAVGITQWNIVLATIFAASISTILFFFNKTAPHHYN